MPQHTEQRTLYLAVKFFLSSFGFDRIVFAARWTHVRLVALNDHALHKLLILSSPESMRIFMSLNTSKFVLFTKGLTKRSFFPKYRSESSPCSPGSGRAPCLHMK